jgi:hypothetical protein
LLVAYPALRERYRAIGRERVRQVTALLGYLSEAGLVVAEPEPGFFAHFSELLWHHSNSALTLLSASNAGASISHAEMLLHTLRLPVLTPLGRNVPHGNRA